MDVMVLSRLSAVVRCCGSDLGHRVLRLRVVLRKKRHRSKDLVS